MLGLFSQLASGANVKNIIFESCLIESTYKPAYYVGIVAGYSEGSISNCVINSSCSINLTSFYQGDANFCVGGIVGKAKSGVIGCYNYMPISISTLTAGYISESANENFNAFVLAELLVALKPQIIN